MKNGINYIEKEPQLSREIEEMISKTRIVWDKPKEEIWSEILDKMEHRNTSSLKIKPLHIHYFRYAAAIFILFIGISAFMSLYSIKIETQLAQQKQLLLPDNSLVTLYEQSSLSYKPFIWKFLRSVKLEGEGFFEVQKGKTFEVVSDKGKTVVLGTSFTVYSRDNDYYVRCKTGKVKVIEFKNHNQVTITGGQKALLIPEGYFKVVNDINKIPENIDDPKNKTLEDELNKILITTPEKETPDNNKNKTKTIEPHPKAKTETVEKKTEELIDQDKKEEILSPDIQTNKNITDKEKTLSSGEEQPQNKERQNKEGFADKKNKFKASLTPEQISILENQQLGKEEKRKAFMQSLSAEQLQLLKEQNEQNNTKELDDIKNKELKEQQKTQIRQQMQENAGKEINEQQKQQNRENKGSGKGE